MMLQRKYYLTSCRMKRDDKMGRKGKLSVTIDADVLDALDIAARNSQTPKSTVAQEAIRLWLRKRTEELMARGYEEMANEDKEFADLTLAAQEEVSR
jgi:predicted transcriptional regulator